MAESETEEGVVYVGSGVKLTGMLYAEDAIVIDGFVDGEITSKSLTVGIDGVVSGQIDVWDADIHGKVTGSITAKQLLTLHSTADVEGSWHCKEIVVERGAVLNGVAGDEQLSVEPERPSAPKVHERAKEVTEPAPQSIRRALGVKLRSPGRK